MRQTELPWVNDHDHPPIPEGIVATQMVIEMHHRAAMTVEKPRQIFLLVSRLRVLVG